MNKFEEAAENYIKSTKLDRKFYKNGKTKQSEKTFDQTLEAFPDWSEPNNYHGKLLLDQQQFQFPLTKFDRAIQLESVKTRPNVLPIP
ncbi:hypothetical protein C0991_006454, partial [Blastosporella zonata]